MVTGLDAVMIATKCRSELYQGSGEFEAGRGLREQLDRVSQERDALCRRCKRLSRGS
jgi:hypothetical protein